MINKSEHIGQKIKFYREHFGYTQINISNFLKVDQSLISMVESGKRALTSDMLDKLAILFGVHLSAFDENSDAMPLSFALRASDIREEDLDTISAINQIALNSSFMTKLLKGENNDG